MWFSRSVVQCSPAKEYYYFWCFFFFSFSFLFTPYNSALKMQSPSLERIRKWNKTFEKKKSSHFGWYSLFLSFFFSLLSCSVPCVVLKIATSTVAAVDDAAGFVRRISFHFLIWFLFFSEISSYTVKTWPEKKKICPLSLFQCSRYLVISKTWCKCARIRRKFLWCCFVVDEAYIFFIFFLGAACLSVVAMVHTRCTAIVIALIWKNE